MAVNKKISELDAAGTLTGAELLAGVQGGVNVKITASALVGLGAQSYLDLTDATTADLPEVNLPLKEALAGKADISTAASGSYLISGGGVAFVSDLDLIVSPAVYVINGVQYESELTPLTVTTADATNDRIDVIALTTSGTAVLVDGTPGATPEKPDIDPATQLELTFVLVPATATTLGVTVTDVYLENTEYTTSQSGSAFNFASTNNPRTGTLCVEATSAANGNYAQFEAPSPIDAGDFDNLVFYIRSKASWPGPKSLTLSLRATNTLRGSSVTVSEGSFGFTSSNILTYQQIVVPMSLFGAGGLSVNRLRIAVSGGGAAIGFYLDDITLQSGIAATADTSRMRWRGNYAAAVAYAANDVVLSSGVQYVAIAASSNRTPASNATFWQPSSAAAGVGDALVANPLSQFAATTSAQLAGVISDETGSGALVFGTSPTLVTPDLGTPSAAVLTNATGLPVAGGGTGVATLTAYAPIFGGTTGTGAVQSGTVGTAGQVLTSNGAGAIATMQSPPFDVHTFLPGLQTSASQLLYRGRLARAVTFAANFAGSYFTATANATGSTVFDIQKNGSSVGTCTIAAASITGTFATSGGTAQSFDAGDVLAIVGPATEDATLADMAFTLAGVR